MNFLTRRCIENCIEANRVCLETVSHCLRTGGVKASYIWLLFDCVEICKTNTNFLLRNSIWSSRTAALCSELCARCATECDNLGDDPKIKACAAACRRCAESCREMAAQATGEHWYEDEVGYEKRFGTERIALDDRDSVTSPS